MCPSDRHSRDDQAMQSCLMAARDGSDQALGQLLQLSRKYLLGVANHELKGPLRTKAGASDLVQETFLEARSIFGRFEGTTSGELRAWLRGILVNKLADLRRYYLATAKRQLAREVRLEEQANDTSGGELPVADNVPTPSSVFGNLEQTRLIVAALKRLPDHCQQVIVWRQWENLPFQEIAERMDRSVDATRMLWWRSIERLQR